jgi:hypothetical protein
MRRFRAFALGLLLAACAPVAQSPSAPSSLAWRHTGSTSFEPRYPGLGTAEHYASTWGVIDVYVYGLGRNDWAPGVNDPQFAAQFEETVDDVRQFAQHGVYVKLRVGATRDVVVSGQMFRCVSFRYSIDGKPILSATYLTARNGQLLKYRVSIGAASGLDVDAVAQAFIEENLRSGRVSSSRNVVLAGPRYGL